ncbi:hypothetical protein [Nonomuraea endophytica]|uniref:Uncharacterized protein n=1 Tax=Nonomuraea endophytica TaxID=714136 RepID=A0A7W8AEX5_9ACTN|nr:hypothetical protein [Nonomuraea endophytica]MBB5084424.1 hypothetical protein [Nonomuraea endophytica]
MSVLQGLPDLGAPTGSGFAAFGRDGLIVSVPDRLELTRRDGVPELMVSLERSLAFPPSGLLELAFNAFSSTPGVPADLRESVLELSVVLGPISPPAVLAADQLLGARLAIALMPEAAQVIARLIEDATLPIDAAVRLAVRAVAPRAAFETVVDPRDLATRLAARLGTGARVTRPELVLALADLLGAGPDAAEELALRAGALVAEPAPGATLDLVLRVPAEVAPGSVRLDLAEPAAVIAHRVLSFDPFAAAREVAGGSLDRHVRLITLPGLPTGQVPVHVSANLPEPVTDLPALLADVRLPAAPPKRPHPVSGSLALDGAGRTGTLTLTLAAGELPSGEARLRALMSTGEEVEGPWRPFDRRQIVLDRDGFPLPLRVVLASDALLALATVDVVRQSGRTAGRLAPGTPTLAVPDLPGDPVARLVIRPLGRGRVLELPVDDQQRLDLDPAVLPGFGGHRARLVALRPPVTVEWAPEAETEVRRVPLSVARPEAEIGWTADSPFRPGMRWRVAPGPWSEPVDGPVITVDQAAPVVVDGVELVPDRRDPSVWVYVPPGPFLDREPSLLVAGDTAFLQLTSRIDLPEAAKAALLGALAGRAGQVRALPVEVPRVALQVKESDTWQDVATGGSSGSPPWRTALSAVLNPSQAEAVKAALSGTAGRARLVAELIEADIVRVQSRDLADLIK